jgi:hypothetical protein
VTSDEYIEVTVGFLIMSVVVAGMVTGLVRKFGWSREGGRRWRLNWFGLAMPWCGGLLLLFGVFYLRGH